MTYLKLEFYKLKRRRVFLTTTIILLIQAVWVIAATDQYLSRGRMLDFPWESLLMTFTSMQVIFFPIAAAVLSSRICDIEHRGNTLKWLETTSETRSRLYLAKFTASNLLLFISSLITFGSLIVYGFFLKDFSPSFPVTAFLTALVGTALVNAALLALFQAIALYFKNQLIVMASGFILLLFGFIPGCNGVSLRGNPADSSACLALCRRAFSGHYPLFCRTLLHLQKRILKGVCYV